MRFKRLILCSLLITTIGLIGCNKDEQPPQQGTTQPVATPAPVINVTTNTEYECGTELTVSSVITISELDMMGVSQTAFLFGDGSVSDKLVVKEGETTRESIEAAKQFLKREIETHSVTWHGLPDPMGLTERIWDGLFGE